MKKTQGISSVNDFLNIDAFISIQFLKYGKNELKTYAILAVNNFKQRR